MHIIRPMLAKASALPAKEADFGYEIKWDGIRAITYIDRGKVRVLSRNLKDIGSQYPELSGIGQLGNLRHCVIDGEIVALDPDGRPSFSRLQHRMGLVSAAAIKAKTIEVPVTYVIFDLLSLDGKSLLELPYVKRRNLLENLNPTGPCWQIPSYKTGEGQSILAAVRSLKLEGIVAKRLDSLYYPGKRTGDWLKIKNQQRQELLICGWTPGQGSRKGRIGSLLVGYYDTTPSQADRLGRPQQLLYAGAVGTGFNSVTLEKLETLLSPLRRTTSPFAAIPPQRDVVFVEPQLVAEIEFTEWTPNNTLRHPSFKGLRNDKDPGSVVREN